MCVHVRACVGECVHVTNSHSQHKVEVVGDSCHGSRIGSSRIGSKYKPKYRQEQGLSLREEGREGK